MKYDPNPSNRPENCIVKYSLIVSSETLMLFYCVSRIRPQSCMNDASLESEVFIQGGGGEGVGDSVPSF